MSIVIIGGHDRMVAQYKEDVRGIGVRQRFFTQMRAGLHKQIGSPDVLVLFTNTVSHKMVKTALDEVDCSRTNVIRCHTSSKNALTEILENCWNKYLGRI